MIADTLAPMRASASAQLGTPVIDAALFSIESRGGAGGLREHLLLAVTEDDVIALDAGGRELTRWRRTDLQVDVRDQGHLLHVTLAAPAAGETVHCMIGKAPATTDFVALLDDPSRRSAARG